jgi:hypothetical protein
VNPIPPANCGAPLALDVKPSVICKSQRSAGTELSSPDSLTNLQADLVLGGFSIVLHLDSQPELDGGSEILGERNPRFRRDAATLMGDVADSGCRQSQIGREGVCAQTERFHKLLEQNLARMSRRNLSRHDRPPFASVIIRDLDIVCSVLTPNEANAILSVDSDRILPTPIPFERFELIAGSTCQDRSRKFDQSQQSYRSVNWLISKDVSTRVRFNGADFRSVDGAGQSSGAAANKYRDAGKKVDPKA